MLAEMDGMADDIIELFSFADVPPERAESGSQNDGSSLEPLPLHSPSVISFPSVVNVNIGTFASPQQQQQQPQHHPLWTTVAANGMHFLPPSQPHPLHHPPLGYSGLEVNLKYPPARNIPAQQVHPLMGVGPSIPDYIPHVSSSAPSATPTPSAPPPQQDPSFHRLLMKQYLQTMPVPQPSKIVSPGNTFKENLATKKSNDKPVIARPSRRRRTSKPDVNTQQQPSPTSSTPHAFQPPLPRKQQQQQQRKQQPQPLLHEACLLYPNNITVIFSALKADPSSIRRRIQPNPQKSTHPPRSSFSSSRNDHHQLPINIALANHASLDVIKLLATAGPDVLAEPDGTDRACSLALALRTHTHRPHVLKLLASAVTVQKADRYSNLPLHVAAASGASLHTIKCLLELHPSAIGHRNFHGQTALDLAQSNTLCSDAVVDFLQQSAFGSLEQDSIHLESDADHVDSDGMVCG